MKILNITYKSEQNNAHISGYENYCGHFSQKSFLKKKNNTCNQPVSDKKLHRKNLKFLFDFLCQSVK